MAVHRYRLVNEKQQQQLTGCIVFVIVLPSYRYCRGNAGGHASNIVSDVQRMELRDTTRVIYYVSARVFVLLLL